MGRASERPAFVPVWRARRLGGLGGWAAGARDWPDSVTIVSKVGESRVFGAKMVESSWDGRLE